MDGFEEKTKRSKKTSQKVMNGNQREIVEKSRHAVKSWWMNNREQERERERERKVDKLFELRDLFLVLIRSRSCFRRNFCLPPYSHNFQMIRKRQCFLLIRSPLLQTLPARLRSGNKIIVYRTEGTKYSWLPY